MKQYFETPTQVLFKQDVETMCENGSRALPIKMKSSADAVAGLKRSNRFSRSRG